MKHKVRAVSYLNTVPLVWGMMHGPQARAVDLSFSIPSECARDVESGAAQIGLVPVAEIARQELEMAPDVGITCLGAVRSILLISKVPFGEIRTLAADGSSRTSVQLARVILRERYGAEPAIGSQAPVLESMLADADAALVIGDPALRIDPERLPYRCLDLGAEWLALTGLPFVFAAWAGKPGLPAESLRPLLRESYEYGRARIVQYLRRYIRFEIGPKEERGLETFFALMRKNKHDYASAGV